MCLAVSCSEPIFRVGCMQARGLEILRITYSSFSGMFIYNTLLKIGRNGRIRDVDFSGNSISLHEAGLISHELRRIPSMKQAFFDFTELCCGSMLHFVTALPYLHRSFYPFLLSKRVALQCFDHTARKSRCSLKQSKTTMEDIVEVFHGFS